MASTTRTDKADATFCKWLAAIGKISMVHGSIALLQMYVHGSGEDWAKAVCECCSTRLDNWIMLRGKLSARDIAQCRERYLDRFVFVCREKEAKRYVDDLLGIEDAQIQIRIGAQPALPACKQCKEKDVVIRGLREQLLRMEARPVESQQDAQLESLRTEFHNTYILDSCETTTRKEVRERMEKHLKAMFGEDERLPAYSPLWKRFTDEVMRSRDRRAYRPFRCRPRKRALEPYPAREDCRPSQAAAVMK